MFTGEIQKLLADYAALNLQSVIGFEKFNDYAITHHSTAIEGSTLSEIETQLLLDEGITPKGKPLNDSLMVKDHYSALLFVIGTAKPNTPLSTEFIQKINSMVMKSTGTIYNTALGVVDSSKGEFRKGNVRAGTRYFVNYDKVIPYTDNFIKNLNEKLSGVNTDAQKLELAFAAQFDLVSIHPFYDGNGRTSRLLMNYLQQLFSLPLSIVHKEDKADYFKALEATRENGNMQIFYGFMYAQLQKQLKAEMERYNTATQTKEIKRNTGKGFSIFF